MAQEFDEIGEKHLGFIRRQHVFFTASAAATGHINLSPRSTSLFRVLESKRVAYLDLTGSGNETAAHLEADGRLTLMFCAFAGAPQILRLYGRGEVLARGTAAYDALIANAFGGTEHPGARHVIALDIGLVKTSCGYGVPLLGYEGERETLDKWIASKGEDGIRDYWAKKNLTSMDGFDTGMARQLDRLRD